MGWYQPTYFCYSMRMEQKRHQPRRAISLLLPPFQPYANTICTALAARGHVPFVFETRRTIERAHSLKLLGKDRKGEDSLYVYGAAIHIIDRIHRYSNPAFFTDLNQIAEQLKLVCGARWAVCGSSVERLYTTPHVLALPPELHKHFRALGSDRKRSQYLTDYFDKQKIKPLIRIK